VLFSKYTADFFDGWLKIGPVCLKRHISKDKLRIVIVFLMLGFLRVTLWNAHISSMQGYDECEAKISGYVIKINQKETYRQVYILGKITATAKNQNENSNQNQNESQNLNQNLRKNSNQDQDEYLNQSEIFKSKSKRQSKQ